MRSDPTFSPGLWRRLTDFVVQPRAAVIWMLCASLLAAYSLMPEGEPSAARTPEAGVGSADAEPHRLTITDIAPSEAAAGSVITVTYEAGESDATPQLRLGKQPLRVLATRPGSLVAQLPDDLTNGTVRLRLTQGAERSKTFDLQIRPFNWQKLLRNACGGLALLALGIFALGRGVRGVLSVTTVQQIALLTRSRMLLLVVGALIGAGMQSVAAAAGLLAGMVGTRAMSVAAAASLFLGAQLGAALAPCIFGSITEPRSGLMAIAAGTFALTFSLDRRNRALAQMLLGGGLVAFGVQVLRPGFEPFASNPLLLSTLDRLGPDGIVGGLATTLLGALLVAVFQGPAPVLALALGIAESTGHENLRTTLFMLAGSGLGAGLGALLILPGGAHSRRLAEVSLLAGLCTTLVSLVSIDGFAWLATNWPVLASHHGGLSWGRHMLPDVSWRIAVAFALSQASATLVLLPLLPYLERRVAALHLRRKSSASGPAPAHTQDPIAAIHGDLLHVLEAQDNALPAIFELATLGTRSRGVSAELQLKDARGVLLPLLSGPVAALAPSPAGVTLGRLALSAMQLQAALENLLRAAEQLTESRLVEQRELSEGGAHGRPDTRDAETTLRQMHELLHAGLTHLIAQVRQQESGDAEDARAREIEMNRLEASSRRDMLAHLRSAQRLGESLPILALSDAYEVAGNQVFRMAEVMERSDATLLSSQTADSAATLLRARRA